MEKVKVFFRKNSKVIVSVVIVITIVAAMVGVFYWDLNKVDTAAYESHISAGESALKERDFVSAFNSYSKAKGVNPKGFEAYSGLLQIMSVKGLYSNADEIVIKASQNLT